ncbi:MAG: ABC transporter permease [Proteobacteria bacterium]|jgi:oligopeptide transport system permease protein|nr:ABC transporter permease [Pseudomonadota bacterium]
MKVKLSALFLVLLCLFSNLVFLLQDFTPIEVQLQKALQGPSWSNFLGTDSLGRDLFLRILLGAQISLFLGSLAAMVSMILGVSLGAVAGWYRGKTENVFMHLVDLFSVVPQFILVLLFVGLIIKQQDFSAMEFYLLLSLGMGACSWMGFARLTRNLVAREREGGYVEAARALGGRDLWILKRHVLPNLKRPLLIQLGIQIPQFLLFESMLGFLGVGVTAPMLSWGLLIQEGWKTLSAYPHLILAPALVLFLTVWSFQNLIDWLTGELPSTESNFKRFHHG